MVRLVNQLYFHAHKKSGGWSKEKSMTLFETNTTKGCSKPMKKQSADKIIKNVRNRFRLKTENKAIKDRTIRDIKNLLQTDKSK